MIFSYSIISPIVTITLIVIFCAIHGGTITSNAQHSAIYPDDLFALALCVIVGLMVYSYMISQDILMCLNIRPSAGASRHSKEFTVHVINATIEITQWIALFLCTLQASNPIFPKESIAYEVILLIPFDPVIGILAFAAVAIFYVVVAVGFWFSKETPSSAVSARVEYWLSEMPSKMECFVSCTTLNGVLAAPILVSSMQSLQIVEHPWHILASGYFVFLWTGGYCFTAGVVSTKMDPGQLTPQFQHIRGVVKLIYFLLLYAPMLGSDRINYGSVTQCIIAAIIHTLACIGFVAFRPSPFHVVNTIFFSGHGVGLGLALAHLPHSSDDSQSLNQTIFFYVFLVASISVGVMYLVRTYVGSRAARSTRNAVTALRVLGMRADMWKTDRFVQQCRRPVEGLLALACSPMIGDRAHALHLMSKTKSTSAEENRNRTSFDEQLFSEGTLLSLALTLGHVLLNPTPLDIHVLRITLSLFRCTHYSHVINQSACNLWSIMLKWNPNDPEETDNVRKYLRSLVENEKLELNVVLLRNGTVRKFRKRHAVRCWIAALTAMCNMDMDLVIEHTDLWSEVINIGHVAKVFKCVPMYVEMLQRIHEFIGRRCIVKGGGELDPHLENLMVVLRANEVDDFLRDIETATGGEIDEVCRTGVRALLESRNVMKTELS